MNIDQSLLDRVLERAIQIQQIPAPTFAEIKRSNYIFTDFRSEINDLHTAGTQAETWIDEIGNVFLKINGNTTRPPLVVSAHSDTVFPASTNLSIRIEPERLHGPGIGDNALGVAGLFGLLWMLRTTNRIKHLPGDVYLVANVGEEGLGNLRGMRAVVERFGRKVSAYLVLEGMALGQVYHRALGVERYRINVHTGGGHSWVDYGMPSAVHELATLITRLTALSLPKRPRTTLNVGVIQGGTTVNTIASEAFMEVDFRSESDRALRELTNQVHDLVRQAETELQVKVEKQLQQELLKKTKQYFQFEIQLIGKRPSGKISANHPLVQLARQSLEGQGIRPQLQIASTDANIPLSMGIPAVCIGLTKGSGVHSLEEAIQIQPLALGLAQLLTLVEGIFTS
jgi:tripeptide aminopeptidase